MLKMEGKKRKNTIKKSLKKNKKSLNAELK